MRLKSCITLLLGMSIVLLSACDRDFGSPPRPDVEVVDPDLTVVQSSAEVGLSLRVDSPRDVDRVTVDGRDLSFDAATSTWMGPVGLEIGYNRLDVQISIGDESPFADTLHAFRNDVSVEVIDQSVLPHDVGGHTITGDDRGVFYLIGGALTVAGAGYADIIIREPGETRFRLRPWRFVAGRVGHTTTLLPDGRILVLGGAFVGGITTIEQLIFEVEIYDPADNSVTLIPTTGAPILRMYHTAVLRDDPDRVVVDLLGGRGDIGSGNNPEIGIRQDLRSFELVNDTLHALHPSPGPFVAPLAGHTQTAVGANTSPQSEVYFVAGMTFNDTLEPVAFAMNYDDPFGLDIADVSPREPGTIRHAAVRIMDGAVALFGGRGEDPSDVRNTISIYAVDANRWFTVDESKLMNFPARYGLTATAVEPGRILVLGGFDASGDALSAPRIVSFETHDN
ncbi:MAG: hypothetical protein HKN17_08260 [Rhodothermales bacterium]|nr:hypothetical protein [Rhodothermales bacterium]